jgi:uncharacterized protein DUF6353
VNIAETVKGARYLAHENRTVLLTAVGVVGTVSTAVLTGRASFKAGRIIEVAEHERAEESFGKEIELDTRERIDLVWTLYIPPVGVGALTIVAIILANRLDAQKAAGLAAAYGISERSFAEYRDKVQQKLGENKEQALRDEIAQERVDRDPVSSKQVIITGNGEVLCKDNISGRYFMGSVEAIKKAENKINHEIVHHMYASLSHFYEEIGLPPTRHSDEIGWNTNNLLEVVFSATMSDDDRPCIVLDYVVGPTQDYTQLY